MNGYRRRIKKNELCARFIRESNLIENITVSYETVIDRLIRKEEDGHVGALQNADWNGATPILLEERLICEWQKLIVLEQNANCAGINDLISIRHIGQYRDCGVYIRTTVNEKAGVKKICPPAKAVPKKMKRLLRAINIFQTRKYLENQPDRDEIIARVAAFHFWFLIIHPFADGNGRTARLLAWYLLTYFGITPFVFTNVDKFEAYYPAFDNPTSHRMKKYFAEKTNQQKAA